jgi:hypothetical protein
VAAGAHGPCHSSGATAYTICPKRYYKVDKFIICQLLFVLIYCGLIQISSVTVGVAIISSALILSPSVPRELHTILGMAYFALASAMACRVFRAVLLGTITEPQLSTLKFESFHRAAADNPFSRSDSGAPTHRPDNTHCSDIKVAVETDTITETDGYALWGRESTKYNGRRDSSEV